MRWSPIYQVISYQSRLMDGGITIVSTYPKLVTTDVRLFCGIITDGRQLKLLVDDN